MTRVLGMFATGLAVVLIATPGAKAGGYYFGVQFGHQPRAHTHAHRGYSGAGYAPGGYAYAPVMLAPAAGCSGSGFAPAGCSGGGFAPAGAFAPGGVVYYHPGYAPGGSQAGLFPFLPSTGGIGDTISLIDRVFDLLERRTKGGTPDVGSSASFAELKGRVDILDRDFRALSPEGVKDVAKRLDGHERRIVTLEGQVGQAQAQIAGILANPKLK